MNVIYIFRLIFTQNYFSQTPHNQQLPDFSNFHNYLIINDNPLRTL